MLSGGFDPPASRLVLRMEMNQSLVDLAPNLQKIGSTQMLVALSDSASHIRGNNLVRMWNHSQYQNNRA